LNVLNSGRRFQWERPTLRVMSPPQPSGRTFTARERYAFLLAQFGNPRRSLDADVAAVRIVAVRAELRNDIAVYRQTPICWAPSYSGSTKAVHV
jgi:hypothetical protein